MNIEVALHKIIKRISEINFETSTYSAQFTNIKNKKTHEVFLEAVKDEKKLAYQTQYQTAYNNNFYNRNNIIQKYKGDKKESTLLEIKAEELIQIATEKKRSAIEQAKGALIYGYNESAISKKYIFTIQEIMDVETEVKQILIENGITNEENHKYVFKMLLEMVDPHTI
jgi:hypothetical protein